MPVHRRGVRGRRARTASRHRSCPRSAGATRHGRGDASRRRRRSLPGEALKLKGTATFTFGPNATATNASTVFTFLSDSFGLDVSVGGQHRFLRIAELTSTQVRPRLGRGDGRAGRLPDYLVPSTASGQLTLSLPHEALVTNPVSTSPESVAFTGELRTDSTVQPKRTVACALLGRTRTPRSARSRSRPRPCDEPHRRPRLRRPAAAAPAGGRPAAAARPVRPGAPAGLAPPAGTPPDAATGRCGCRGPDGARRRADPGGDGRPGAPAARRGRCCSSAPSCRWPVPRAWRSRRRLRLLRRRSRRPGAARGADAR